MTTKIQETDRGRLLVSPVNAGTLGRGDMIVVELVLGMSRPTFHGLRAATVINSLPRRGRPGGWIIQVRTTAGNEYVFTPKTNEPVMRVVGGRAGGHR